MEDPSGDSAIIEYIDGKMVVHHGKQFTVMTNDPAYDVQIEDLKQYKGFGGSKQLPGGISGADRFVRGSHFVKHLPEPEDESQAAGYALSAIRNLAVPFGAPYQGRTGASTYPTWWISVTDVTHGTYYFNWAKNPNIVWVELDRLDFSEGKPVMMLDPRNPSLVGDVSRSFTEAKGEAFLES